MYRHVMFEADRKGYYACLGVRPFATLDEIREAYYRCAKQYHPDKDPSPSAKARFQAVDQAYRTLSNPSRRAAYDRVWHATLGDRYRAKLERVPLRLIALDAGLRARSVPRPASVAGVVGVAALGLALVALLFGRPAVEITPPSPDLLSRRAEAQSMLSVALPQLSLGPAQTAGAPSPRLPPAQNTPLSGAWLLRDIPNPRSALNLLPLDEAVRLQKQLFERGYLIGAADGLWDPRAHAALEDFRRVGVPDASRTEETQKPSFAQQPEMREPVTREESEAVQEDATPPPTPSLAPGPELAALEQVPTAASYIGAWARSRADCFQTGAPPLAISAGRADSFGGVMGSCEFEQVQRDGSRWRTRARCSADGRNWMANVRLSVNGATLVWSSERGRATYYRCPGR